MTSPKNRRGTAAGGDTGLGDDAGAHLGGGAERPAHAAGGEIERVDRAVVAADVHRAVGDGRLRARADRCRGTPAPT